MSPTESPRPSRRLRRRSALTAFAATALTFAVASCPQDAGDQNTAVRPEPREGAWETLHRRYVERARAGGIDLLFLGDSITLGWTNPVVPGPGAVWERHYAPRRAAAFGIGGDRTQHVLWRVEHGELDGLRPKVVVLLVGTNNLDANTPDEIAAGVGAIVGAVRRRAPEAKILVLSLFPRGPKGDPVRARVAAVNARLGKFDDGKAVRVLDLGPHFLSEGGELSRDVMPDLLHLSARGYQIWAEAMEPTLWGMMDEPASSR